MKKKIQVKLIGNLKNCWDRVFAVGFFSVAFGMVEALVVIYLRQILVTTSHDIFSNASLLATTGTKAVLVSLGFIVFLRPEVLATWDTLHFEILRELATMVMLASIAYVASRKWWHRLAYFLLSFGVWDIFYYLWLYFFIGWPRTLMDVDVLFLIPVPWIARVILPVSISFLMVFVSLFILDHFPSKDKRSL